MKVQLLQDLLTRRAAVAPEATAVVMGSERLSYRALDEASNRLARMLEVVGCVPGDRVGLLVPKSPSAIVAMLATLKAGCVYVPIDPASPAPRAARIVASCEPACILATDKTAMLAADLQALGFGPASVALGWLDRPLPRGSPIASFGLEDVERLAPGPFSSETRQGDAAHILFTSGSTGQPKGVVITHENVLAFVEWATRYFGMTSSDRVSGHSPLHFDLSTFDVYGALAVGAELHLVPPELNLLPDKLAAFIRGSELTQWFSVPSALGYLARFDAIAEGDFAALQRILWCGDVLPTAVLSRLMRRLPHVTFTNLYGPTEATIASSYYTVPRPPEDEQAPIPIGTACGGEELLVLDDRLQPIPTGEIGDLYIGGVGLSPGYFGDREKTEQAFVERPSHVGSRVYRTGDLARMGDDGLVYFVGRSDTQIKSRGYRIELGEIESAANTIASLAECAVVALPTGGFEGAIICMAYAPAPGADSPAAKVREDLARLLPTYMLPSRWLVLERLPKNANGKIDRRALKERFESSAGESARPPTDDARSV